MILPIYIEPQPVLRQPARAVSAITPELIQLATDMRETMHNAQGIGLAAPQIGQSIAFCVLEYATDEGEVIFPFMALFNPRVTWRSTKQVSMSEACLSVPGVEADLKRPDRVRVKAKNLEGEIIEIEASGLLARALQHEIDHLHGVLFTSYVSKKELHSRPLVDYPQL